MDAKAPKNEQLFRDQPVWKAIAALAIPSLLSILVMIFYNLADTFFIAQLGDTAKVAAVSIVSPVFSIIMALGTMLGVGAGTLLSVAFGAGESEKAKDSASLCFYSGIVLSLIVSVLLLCFSTPLLRFLGTQPEMWEDAESYLRILACGTVFMIASHTLSALIRAEGAVREGLYGYMAGTITNIVLDPLFILVFRWGVAGAAVATVLGNIVSTLLYLLHIRRHATVVSLDPKRALTEIKALGRILALGVPNAVSTLLSGFASTFSNQLLSTHGTDAIAAMSAAGKASMLISMVQMGICMGVQPLLAYNYGARNVARLKETLRKIALLTVLVGLAAAALCFTFRRWVIGLFLKETGVAELGESLILWLIAGAPFLGFVYLSTNYLQASQKASAAILVSLLRQGLLLIPLLYVFHWLLGLTGIAAAHLATDIGAAVLSMIVFAVYYRRITLFEIR
jgi:putative MATE family efflux protein